jgi:hypothetical protein
MHSYAIGPAGLEPLHSRPVPLAQTPAPVFAAAGQERVRIAGFDVMGALRTLDLDLATAPTPRAEMLARDWPAVLGLRLDDAGEATFPDP